MEIAEKVANYFGTTEDQLHFEEGSYFAFSRSCTVRVGGAWFDVWFDAEYNIRSVAEAK